MRCQCGDDSEAAAKTTEEVDRISRPTIETISKSWKKQLKIYIYNLFLGPQEYLDWPRPS